MMSISPDFGQYPYSFPVGSIQIAERKKKGNPLIDFLLPQIFISVAFFLPGQSQSPFGNFARASTLPYLKLNPMLERILADWTGFIISPLPAVLKNEQYQTSNIARVWSVNYFLLSSYSVHPPSMSMSYSHPSSHRSRLPPWRKSSPNSSAVKVGLRYKIPSRT